jgi:F-type H+-transporting ATPase subunit gamma
MANPRALDRQRKSIRNIRKITRTMELIATARFRRAMERATAANAYTQRMTQLVADVSRSGVSISHPLLESRQPVECATLLVLTANRGLCGGFNANAQRVATQRWENLASEVPRRRIEISGRRGIGGFKFRGITADEAFTHFEDKPTFDEVDLLASRYLDEFITRRIDRLDVAYTKFISASQQEAVVETLLPIESIAAPVAHAANAHPEATVLYDFLPSPASILEEIVPTSFRVKLFNCFLDSAVSEQIARRVAMKAATENADDLIRQLSMRYNRARQGQITSELTDLIGGVEALK